MCVYFGRSLFSQWGSLLVLCSFFLSQVSCGWIIRIQTSFYFSDVSGRIEVRLFDFILYYDVCVCFFGLTLLAHECAVCMYGNEVESRSHLNMRAASGSSCVCGCGQTQNDDCYTLFIDSKVKRHMPIHGLHQHIDCAIYFASVFVFVLPFVYIYLFLVKHYGHTYYSYMRNQLLGCSLVHK